MEFITKYGHMREKTQQTVLGCDSSPPSRKAQPRAEETKGRMEGDLGGGQRSGCGMEKGDWRRFRRWLDDRRFTFYRSGLLSKFGVGVTHDYEENNDKQSLIIHVRKNPYRRSSIHTHQGNTDVIPDHD